MPSDCFVIQPFDHDAFDRRYAEVYRPAIEAAKLIPYRVDHDPSASIPVERIEQRIKESDVCFADISLDNPNVWFEVGLAIAHRKEICIVCSAERTIFPFDVQHRHIIRYSMKSPSDFDLLRQKIVERLLAISATAKSIEAIPVQVLRVGAMPDSLNEAAISALGVFAALSVPETLSVAIWEYRKQMLNIGFTDIASNVSLLTLGKRGLSTQEQAYTESGDPYTAYGLTEKGWDWVENNMHRFQLRAEAREQRNPPEETDEIPF